MRLPIFLFILMTTCAPAFAAASDQRLSDLLLQIERLQQEVQQLRGQIEVHEHEIATLRQQQRDQYLDLDSRIRGGSVAAPSVASDHGAEPAVQSPPPGTAGAALGSPRAAADSQSSEKDAYRAAFDLLKQRRYDDAIGAFEDLLVRYPNGELADNAYYWLGEASYVKRDYATALTQFQRVLAKYPLSPKIPASMLKIGYIHYDRSDWKRARSSLREVVEKFPDSTEARLAASRLERMTREGH
jgi:tol-pal system protein YbgF